MVSTFHFVGVLSKPKLTSRIFGGAVAKPYPWMASLRASEMSFFKHCCGATILKKKFVITAAHCVEKRGNFTSEYRIYVGANGRYDGQEFDIEKFITHPLYSKVFF